MLRLAAIGHRMRDGFAYAALVERVPLRPLWPLKDLPLPSSRFQVHHRFSPSRHG